jgi:16S rRNA (cytidine1402-2'-O)-methyltransferase
VAKGILYLIPVPLADSAVVAVVPANVKELVASLTVFIVENAKTARHWLKWYDHPTELRQLTILELKQTDGTAEFDSYLAPLLQGNDVGLMSEAGCPGIADPGADVVQRAHRAGIRVVPMVGPSSILLALMASGLNGQRFSFHGYLPVDRNERAKAIAELEQRSRRDRETQIFIETPYRNSALFQALIDTCRGETLLCLATEVTGENETIGTRSIAEWRKNIPNLEKRPTVFLLLGKV